LIKGEFAMSRRHIHDDITILSINLENQN